MSTNSMRNDFNIIATVVDSKGYTRYYIFDDKECNMLLAIKPKDLRTFFFVSQDFYDWPNVVDHEGVEQITNNVMFDDTHVRVDDKEAKKISISLYNRLYRDYGCSTGFKHEFNVNFDSFVNEPDEGICDRDAVIKEIENYKTRAEALSKKSIGVTREKATKIISEVIETAKDINADKAWPYKVEMLGLFGSYVNSDKDKLGDIDMLFTLGIKPGFTRDQIIEMNMQLSTESDLNGTVNQCFSRTRKTEELTLRKLKNHHTSISMHDYEEHKDFLKNEKSRIIYRAN